MCSFPLLSLSKKMTLIDFRHSLQKRPISSNPRERHSKSNRALIFKIEAFRRICSNISSLVGTKGNLSIVHSVFVFSKGAFRRRSWERGHLRAQQNKRVLFKSRLFSFCVTNILLTFCSKRLSNRIYIRFVLLNNSCGFKNSTNGFAGLFSCRSSFHFPDSSTIRLTSSYFMRQTKKH